MRGLSKVRKAVAECAGWEWCEEHQKPRYGGIDDCFSLHIARMSEGWQDYNPITRDE